MNLDNFETYMNRLYAAFGKLPNNLQMGEYFDSFKDTDDTVFISAFQNMKDECERFPTIAMMKSKIAQAQRALFGAGKSHFDEEKWNAVNNGAGCNCERGLIFTKRPDSATGQTYSYVYRCPVCNSYDAPCIPEYDYRKLQPEEMAA